MLLSCLALQLFRAIVELYHLGPAVASESELLLHTGYDGHTLDHRRGRAWRRPNLGRMGELNVSKPFHALFCVLKMSIWYEAHTL